MDELKKPARFRLVREPHNWTIKRSYVGKKDATKLPAEKWKTHSYHGTFKTAAKALLEALIAEGYKPKGLEQLVERVEEAERRVVQFVEDRIANKDAEAELIP